MDSLNQSLINIRTCAINQSLNKYLHIMSPINNNSATYKLLINKFKFTGPTNDIYKLLNNKSITSSTLHLLLFMFMYTGTPPFTNKSTNNWLLLIYKLLMFISNAISLTFLLLGRGRVTTRTNRSLLVIKSLLFIKSLIFFLLLCNQVEGTSISLIKLNLFPIPISISSSNISGTTMSNPLSPINARVLNNPIATPPSPPLSVF